jgi:hypothetical protein
MVVRLVGQAIRPRDLSWIGADNADKWLAVLRTNTPLGGVYLCNTKPKVIKIHVDVVDAQGHLTQAKLNEPRYLFPSEVMQRVADLREYLADQKRRVERGLDVSKIPPKFRSLNGLWGEWGIEEILEHYGFRLEARYGDFDNSPLSSRSPKQIYVRRSMTSQAAAAG